MTISTLDGTFNFRDLGGFPLTDGGTTRTGVFYRSDALSGLTAAGLAELSASDIGEIVDFRTAMEREMAPNRLPTDPVITVVEAPLMEGAVSGMAQEAAQSAAPTDDPDAAAAATVAALANLPALGDLYVAMLEHGAGTFAEVARLVAASVDERPTAVLVHCTAGKDRTGVATAVVLDAVGVERSAIVADYTATAAHLAGPWADRMFAMVTSMGLPITPALETLIAGSPPEAIEQALAWIEATHGGSAAYLQSGGLTDDELAALRRRLTA
ncbi:tyrosine-protein phosphatase [Microbacterium sp. Root61]|uniref:tyrosine-protein phosphatase n=1 Tax=Microbacterium sp. Root61 TaxID=1736570 RepID=UPI000A9C8B73|nr:tyrosine-protein phosphatase [Microbacterium sp. Root61]